MNNERMMDAVELASRLGVNRKTVWRLAQQGRIPAPSQRIGARGIYLWKASDLDAITNAYLANRKRRSQPSKALAAPA